MYHFMILEQIQFKKENTVTFVMPKAYIAGIILWGTVVILKLL